MELDKIKKRAADVLKTTTSKVWLNPAERERIKEALTREDIRSLIAEGLIKKKKTKQHSRGRARILHAKKKAGRKKGKGKRKGTYKARSKKKTQWIKNVRAQRKLLKKLKEKKTVSKEEASEIYRKIKGNYFKGKRYIEAFVKKVKK